MRKILQAMGHVVPWVFLLGLGVVLFIDPIFFETSIMQKDNASGAGLIENGTVVVLLVGIGFGIAALIGQRKKFPGRLLFLWTLGWTSACIYFAGEEASWGQWIFGWKSPEVFQEINQQQETNLHNVSSWLNEKPRTLVELWMITAGLILPIFFSVKRQANSTGLIHWLYPGSVGASTALCFCVLKIIGFIETDSWVRYFGNSEIRELYIAYFLSLYLVVLFFRLRREKSCS